MSACVLLVPGELGTILTYAAASIIAIQAFLSFLIGLPRYLAPLGRVIGLTLAAAIGASVPDWRPMVTSHLGLALALVLVVLSIGLPIPAKHFRSLAFLALRIGWGIALFSLGTAFELELIVVLAICEWELRKWARGSQPFESWGKTISRWARSVFEPEPGAYAKDLASRKSRYAFERLIFSVVQKRWVSMDRKIQIIYALPRRFPGVPLAWQVAYWVALRRQEYAVAYDFVNQARRAGHWEFFGDRQSGKALWGSQDPMWKAILYRGGVSAIEAPTVDPTSEWRRADATFERLQEMLSAGL